MTLYEELSTGLQQAIVGMQGEGEITIRQVKVNPVKKYTSEQIKKIRQDTRMSQKVFAGFLGVSSKTIEAWETGSKSPSGAACRILNMIELDNNIFNRYPFVSQI